MTCEAIEVPAASFNVFNNSLAPSGTLYVPAQSVEKYKESEGWSVWRNIEAITVPDTDDDAAEKVTLEIEFSSGVTMKQLVPKGKAYTFELSLEEGASLRSVVFNGKNVTVDVKENKYTTPALDMDSNIAIDYSRSAAKAYDIDGDGQFTVTDIPALIQKILGK